MTTRLLTLVIGFFATSCVFAADAASAAKLPAPKVAVSTPDEDKATGKVTKVMNTKTPKVRALRKTPKAPEKTKNDGK